MRATFLAMGAVCAAMAWAEPSFYDGVAAYVNNKVVTVDTVMRQIHSNFNLAQVPPTQVAARIREYFPVMRDLLVDRMLILEAYEASGAQLPNEAVNARVQDILATRFGGDEAKLKESLRLARMTREEWVRQVREDLIVQAMRQQQVDRKIVVSPKKVREWYAAHKETLAEEAGIHVRMILIDPAGGSAAARKALAELEAGKDFGEVAKAYSKDSHAAQGGDWGFVKPEENFAPQVAQTLVGLRDGERSGIIELGGWRAIVQRVATRTGRVRPLSEVWAQAEAAVRNELGQARYNAWIEGLRKGAYVRNVDVELQ